MDDLTGWFRAAPRSAAPQRDLWVAIEPRLQSRGSGQWLKAAAAIVIFMAGALVGREFTYFDRENSRGTSGLGDGMLAAAAVQNAGSEYLAALAQLRDVAEHDSLSRTQGYEVALTVLDATAVEVTAALPLLSNDAQLLTSTRNAHSLVAQRVTQLVEGPAR